VEAGLYTSGPEFGSERESRDRFKTLPWKKERDKVLQARIEKLEDKLDQVIVEELRARKQLEQKIAEVNAQLVEQRAINEATKAALSRLEQLFQQQQQQQQQQQPKQ